MLEKLFLNRRCYTQVVVISLLLSSSFSAFRNALEVLLLIVYEHFNIPKAVDAVIFDLRTSLINKFSLVKL